MKVKVTLLCGAEPVVVVDAAVTSPGISTRPPNAFQPLTLVVVNEPALAQLPSLEAASTVPSSLSVSDVAYHNCSSRGARGDVRASNRSLKPESWCGA